MSGSVLGDMVDGKDGITKNGTIGDCMKSKRVIIIPEPEERMKTYHEYMRTAVWKWKKNAERK